MYVHVGVFTFDVVVEVMNEVWYFLSYLFVLSVSSLFWLGCRLGLMSICLGVFWCFLCMGIFSKFCLYAEFKCYIEILVEMGCIEDVGKIWWDLCVHHRYLIVEFRICDLTTWVEETFCLTVLVQAIVMCL